MLPELPAALVAATRDLPRVSLFDAPSPLHRLERLSAALGGGAELWIKREDLLPLAFGGNKLRNLEFLVGAALAEGADSLVTSGRRWSNHCRLTAAAGARHGLDVHLVLSGPPADGAAGPQLDRILGATVHQLATADRELRATTVDFVATELRNAGKRPYVIPVGGSGLPGAWGQVLAAFELLVQAAEAGFAPDVTVVPSATGGTQAGLIAGLRVARSRCGVVGVVAAQGADEVGESVRRTLDELAIALDLDLTAEEIEVDGEQLGDGYGIPTPAAEAATQLLARTEGLLVDPIYTAKGLAGLIASVRAGGFDGQRVVFWHAGGLPGLFEPLDG